MRTWNLGDLDDFYEYAKNPNVGPNAGWEPHTGKDVSRKILQSFIEKDEVWAIVYKENRKVIGSLGLHKDGKRNNINAKMLGYMLSEDYWGLGLAIEAAMCAIKFAFEEMNIDLLSVFHYPLNDRSKRVIEKCGFRYEGTLRRANEIYNGQVLDSVCYSILKEDYLAQ